jgi:ABC-type branched-subunit amino acid transport system substrate-binding protein
LQNRPDAKIAVLYQNDDFGKDYLKGFKDGLGERAAKMIVAEASYELTDPTVDSQIITLKGSGADTLFNSAAAKASAQAIRKVHDIGWRPLHIISGVSVSVATVLTPAGLDKIDWPYLFDLFEGSDRCAMEKRFGDARMARLDEQVLSGWQRHRCIQRLWL